MRTLIRGSQLHPDVSGLIRSYTDPLYPNYNEIYGVSGLKATEIDDYLFLSINNIESGLVHQINGASGVVNLIAQSGLSIYRNGSNIYIGMTGVPQFVKTLNGLSGVLNLKGGGIVDVWTDTQNSITISGLYITGAGRVLSYDSGNYIVLDLDKGVKTVNSLFNDIELVGQNGLSVTATGQKIYLDASQAAYSGVNAINNLQNAKVTIETYEPSKDIDIQTISGNENKIIFQYIGSGWGENSLGVGITGFRNDVNWIGSNNVLSNDNSTFTQGSFNTFFENDSVASINGFQNILVLNKETTFVNCSGSLLTGIHKSTIINANFDGSYRNQCSFAVGSSSKNSYYNITNFRTKIEGFNYSGTGPFNPVKRMHVPLSSPRQFGIFVETGCVVVGHVDYSAIAYHITDNFASADIVNNGIYGRKFFTIQRKTNLAIELKDVADIYGGQNIYNVYLSGAADGHFYLMASGYSGHNVLFMANIQYTNFSLNLSND